VDAAAPTGQGEASVDETPPTPHGPGHVLFASIVVLGPLAALFAPRLPPGMSGSGHLVILAACGVGAIAGVPLGLAAATALEADFRSLRPERVRGLVASSLMLLLQRSHWARRIITVLAIGSSAASIAYGALAAHYARPGVATHGPASSGDRGTQLRDRDDATRRQGESAPR
jgi:hypothetical protein